MVMVCLCVVGTGSWETPDTKQDLEGQRPRVFPRTKRHEGPHHSHQECGGRPRQPAEGLPAQWRTLLYEGEINLTTTMYHHICKTELMWKIPRLENNECRTIISVLHAVPFVCVLVQLSKTVVAARAIEAGQVLEERDLVAKVADPRGLAAERLDSLLGSRLNRDVGEDESIMEEDILWRLSSSTPAC